MSTFHGQTRPDVPRIPQDLATKLYVDDLPDRNTFFRAVKPVDESRTNDTVLSDDADFVFTPEINKAYAGMFMLFYQCPTAQDFKYVFSLPSGASGTWLAGSEEFRNNSQIPVDVLTVLNRFTNSNQQTECNYFRILMGATAGDIAWQWAQVTSGPASIMRAGSFMIVWEEN